MIRIPCYSIGWGLTPTLATLSQWFNRWRIKRRNNYQTINLSGRCVDGVWLYGLSDSLITHMCSNDNDRDDLRCEFVHRSISDRHIRRAFYFRKEFIDLLQFPYSVMVFKGLSNTYRVELIIHDEDAMMLKLIWGILQQ